MKEVACGCVPWRKGENGNIEVLMILRPRGFWEFPKGKQDKGENDAQTASRELKEETNLTGDISTKDVINYEYVYKRDGVRIDKTVRLYLCKIPEDARVKIQKKEVSDFIWLPLEDVAQQATYPEMKEAARQVCKLLKD
jgi:8-oxo-dGTP pyrophosphatase MutT (NUDIX family)